MLRIIREEEAPPLSRKLTAMGAAAADIAARRQTDPASLRRLVDGDLNWITMKALEKARERRYRFGGRICGRYSEAYRAPAGVGVAAEPPVPSAQVSSQAQAGRFRHGGRARVHRFKRSDGLVVRAPRFSAETQADRQGHDRSRQISRMPRAIRRSMERFARSWQRNWGSHPTWLCFPMRA